MVRDDEMPPAQQDRSVFLAVLLGLTMLAGLLGFFWLVAPAYFLLSVVAVGGLSLYGGLHYLLWGKKLMEETAAERAALAEQDQAEAAALGVRLPHDRRY